MSATGHRASLVAALFALEASGGCFLAPLYAEELPPAAERHEVRTDDGWRIALVRYRPLGPTTGRPVLLCHGTTGNGRHMDLDARHSMARWFASQGREAWTVTLRDSGLSDHADPERGRRYAYTVDDYALRDLAAAVAFVREATGGRDIDYVGHSLGGIALYVYLGTGGRGVHAAATLGSPVRFRYPGRGERLLKALVAPTLQRLGHLKVGDLAKTVMPLHGEGDGLLERLLYNKANVTAATWKRLIASGGGDVSADVIRQIAGWIGRDEFRSADRTVDYLESLRTIRVPIFVIAGKVDYVAPPASAKAAYSRLGGPKEFFLAGEENGTVADYGHMDLIIGERAANEVWSKVREFLDRTDTLGPPLSIETVGVR